MFQMGRFYSYFLSYLTLLKKKRKKEKTFVSLNVYILYILKGSRSFYKIQFSMDKDWISLLMYFIEFSPVIQLNKYSIEDISDASLNSAEVRKKKKSQIWIKLLKEQFQNSLSINYVGPMRTKFQFQMLNMTEDP